MDKKILKKLFKLANKSLEQGEFPVAAIIYKDNEIISCGYNTRNKSNRTIDHAEIIAINKANKKLNSWRLQNICMVVTLEPCDMCKAVIKEARIDNVYYIVTRYKYKRQYKCTSFKNIKTDLPEEEEYLRNIQHFFNDKR